MKWIIAGTFYLPFRWLYLSDSLRLAISKNIHKQNVKRKETFYLCSFHLSQGEEKRQFPLMVNSNLPWEEFARRKAKAIRKSHSKKITIFWEKEKYNYFFIVSLKITTGKYYAIRENHPLSHNIIFVKRGFRLTTRQKNG